MVTILDVARAAGVSPMTVSNVINGHPNVRDTTRLKVLAAVQELDYRVNRAARSLRQGRTGTIGFVVPEVDSAYFGELAARVITHARTLGYQVVLEQTSSSREAELDAVRLSRNHVYDGLILSAVGIGPEDANVLRTDHPLVVLGERIFGGPVDHIAMPNVDGSRAAVEELLRVGCRRIALVCGPERSPGLDMDRLRRRGFHQALEAAGVAFDLDLLIEGDAYIQQGAAAARILVERGVPFDGAFCVTDAAALGFIRGLADVGLRVPQDVKVVGFDDILQASYSVPSLTTVAPDHEWTARTALSLLHERITGAADGPPRELTAHYDLVRRESTGPGNRSRH